MLHLNFLFNIDRAYISRNVLHPREEGISAFDNIVLHNGIYYPSSGLGVIQISSEGLKDFSPIHEAYHAAMLNRGKIN